MRVLVVEDDVKTAGFLHKGLAESGYVVDVAYDGEDGLEMALNDDPDLIILDVMLPRKNGWDFVRDLRKDGAATPVLMLTACESVACRIKGLTLGADDYLVKPFAFGELLARVRTILRRQTPVNAFDTLKFEDLFVDPARHKAQRGPVMLELSVKELLLLQLLLRHQGEVLSRTYIAEHVWDAAFECDSNVIDVNIRRLRSKVDDPFSRKLIHTIRGRGYVLR
jgi:two-component system copper resistance phosphate regulon response regulator CusR